VTSVNCYQLKRIVKLRSGTAGPSSAVLWLWVLVPFVVVPVCMCVCGLGSDEQEPRYINGVLKYRGVKSNVL